jgi:hypothetical protein
MRIAQLRSAARRARQRQIAGRLESRAEYGGWGRQKEFADLRDSDRQAEWIELFGAAPRLFSALAQRGPGEREYRGDH